MRNIFYCKNTYCVELTKSLFFVKTKRVIAKGVKKEKKMMGFKSAQTRHTYSYMYGLTKHNSCARV